VTDISIQRTSGKEELDVIDLDSGIITYSDQYTVSVNDGAEYIFEDAEIFSIRAFKESGAPID
jgi:hypothetical protein